MTGTYALNSSGGRWVPLATLLAIGTAFLMGSAAVTLLEFDDTAHAFTEQAVKDSFVYGFRWAMSVSAFLALAGGLVSFMVIHGATRRHPSDNGPGG